MDQTETPEQTRSTIVGAPRIVYLEALRGIAAVQVVLLHICTALFPGLTASVPSLGTVAAYIHASPLFFLYDGYSAVYIFFVLSGYVLTGAFAKQHSFFSSALGRIVRLGVPVLCGCVLAAGFYWAFRGLHDQVGRITHSTWMADLWHPKLTVGHILYDALVSGLLVGYENNSVLQPLLYRQPQTITSAFDFPLWTLSIELQGSVLVFLLCDARKGRRGAWLGAVMASLALTGFTYFTCFIVGHLAATCRLAERPPALRPLSAVVLCVGGIFLCVRAELWQAAFLKEACRLQTLYSIACSSASHIQKAAGAVFVFLGVLQLKVVRRWLSCRFFAVLGRVSFPLYIVHVPILFGPAAWIFLRLQGTVSEATTIARLCAAAAAAALAGSFVLAFCFAPIDTVAVQASRWVRATCDGIGCRIRRRLSPR